MSFRAYRLGTGNTKRVIAVDQLGALNCIRQNFMKRPPFVPTKDYLCNHVINRMPFHDTRMAAYRALGIRIGPESTILLSTEVKDCEQITIGNNTIINQHCLLDGRGTLTIGSNVNVSSHVLIVAGKHDVQAESFHGYAEPIEVQPGLQ